MWNRRLLPSDPRPYAGPTRRGKLTKRVYPRLQQSVNRPPPPPLAPLHSPAPHPPSPSPPRPNPSPLPVSSRMRGPPPPNPSPLPVSSRMRGPIPPAFAPPVGNAGIPSVPYTVSLAKAGAPSLPPPFCVLAHCGDPSHPPPQTISSYKSNHVGLPSSINRTFHARYHFFRAFSLALALSIDS